MNTTSQQAVKPSHIFSPVRLTVIGIFIILAEKDDFVSSTELAKELDTSKSNIERLSRFLAKNDCIVSRRGTNGGMTLIREPHEITVLDMIGLTIFASSGDKRIDALGETLINELDNTTLADLLAT